MADKDDVIKERVRQITSFANIAGYCCLILAVLLFASIALLIWSLRVKLKELKKRGETSDNFGKETWNVIAIMVVFSSSLFIRWFQDSIIL